MTRASRGLARRGVAGARRGGTSCTPSPTSRRSPPRARASSCAPRACTSTTRTASRSSTAMSGLWCVNVGYGRAELADARARWSSCRTTTASSRRPPPGDRAGALLVDVTPPQFNHVFFTGSGSEANDTVVRMVRRYWDLLGQPDRTVIISRENAYHGSTMAGASLGGMASMHAQGGLPIPGIVHIRQPYWYADGGELSPEEFGRSAAQALEEKILEIGAESVAAFIGEPIQGAGGVIIPPETYWPEIQRICDRYGILLVADEVICGFGRTGHWFGCQTSASPGPHADRQGHVVGLSADRRRDGRRPRRGGADRAGGEFPTATPIPGHPVACAVACANLRIIEREKHRRAGCATSWPLSAAKWRQLAEHPLVGEARCRPHRRPRAGAGQGQPPLFRQARRGGHDLPRLPCERPHHARGARHDDRLAAPGHQPGAARRAGREGAGALDMTLASCRAEGRL